MAFMVYVYAPGADPEVDPPIEEHGPIAHDESANRLGLTLQHAGTDDGTPPRQVRIVEIME